MRKKLVQFLLLFVIPLQAYAAPVLVNPKDNTEVDTSTPTLTWQSTGASRYVVRGYDSTGKRVMYIAVNPQSGGPGCAGGSGNCSKTYLSKPFADGAARWQVKADNGAFSDFAYFTVNTGSTVPPAGDVPTILSPKDNTEVDTSTPTLSWQSTGAAGYTVRGYDSTGNRVMFIAVNPAYGGAGCADGSGNCSKTYLTKPFANGLARWQVQANNGDFTDFAYFNVNTGTSTADTQAPVITLNGDNPLTVIQGEVFSDPGATATDNKDGTSEVTVSGNVDTAAGGTYTLTYTATDTAGNTATATRSVIVVEAPDTTAPVITLNGDNPLTITQGENFTDPGTTATDNKDGNVNVTVSGSVDTATAGNYTLTYSATDSTGNTATVMRTVTVIALPETDYGVTVSPVSGNTATYNAIAEFYVALRSQPTADVVIPVASSDPTEGVTNVTSLTFTTDNWDRSQQVVGKGRNPDVENGEQNYSIILGAADSIDQNYHGLDPEDVAMTGIRLSISSPREEMLKLIAGRRARIELYARYSGHENLTFSLATAPSGMTLEQSGHSADLIWQQPVMPAGGGAIPVVVEVTDGSRAAQLEFEVTVTVGTLLQTQIEGRKVTITDDSTNLKGVSFEFPTAEGNPADLKIYKMDPGMLPDIRSAYPPGADMFYIEPEIPESTKVETPTSIFSGAVSYDTHVFHVMRWSDGPVFDHERGFWKINNRINKYYYDSEHNQVLEFSRPLKGLYYISVQERAVPLSLYNTENKVLVANIGVTGEPGSQGAVGVDSVSCTPSEKEVDKFDYGEQICTAAGIDVKFIIYDFSTDASSTRWNNVTIETLASWLFTAKSEAEEELGLIDEGENIEGEQ